MTDLIAALIWVLVGTVSCTVSLWKWLRVAQREHYQPGRVSAIALIWNRALPVNWVLVALAVAGLAASYIFRPAGIAAIVLAVFWPWGMPITTKKTPLVVTGRVKRLLAVSVVLEIALATAAALGYPPALAAVLLALPALTDLALLITKPVEAALGRVYVAAAQRRLSEVAPLVVAITGSYGKTSTKSYASQLISGSKRTLASPASFNNLLGLSKAVNDALLPGIEVFIAEMGTYGPGEIERLCRLFEPSIAAITTIGEAHLERMRTRETIVAAKAEILERAHTAVLNIDVPELAELADTVAPDKTVLRCSASTTDCDIAVLAVKEQWRVYLDGTLRAEIPAPPTGHRINLAVAVAIARSVGVDDERIVAALGNLPQPPHRAEVATTGDGTVVIDDTYNSNPEGAAAAIRAAMELARDGATVWTITPGMIELGTMQRDRNRALAREATAAPNMRLVITGYVNRRDLLAGATDRARTIIVKDLAAARRLIEKEAAPGDVLLYENDLPSHYP